MDQSHILVAGLATPLRNKIITLSGLHEMPADAMYLGMPLIHSWITTANCLPLYDKITNRLQSWLNAKLSEAGRLVIVQSIGIVITTYWSRHYILPTKLIKMITTALNKFLWHGDPFSRKMIPISLIKL